LKKAKNNRISYKIHTITEIPYNNRKFILETVKPNHIVKQLFNFVKCIGPTCIHRDRF
jgi:hypothetical protein